MRPCIVCGIPTPSARCAVHALPARRKDHSWRTPQYRKAREKLLRDNPTCYWCGAVATEADHVVPRVQGGSHDFIVPACKSCNSSRTPWSA